MGSINTDWSAGADDIEIEALIVGGGLSGLYTLYKLRKEGIDARIFEAGKRLGGVWNYNRYPGARVDSEVPYYQYSIPEVYKTWTWTERFPGQAELLRYIDHVARTLNLYEHIAFGQNVCGSDFDPSSNRWVVTTDAGKTIRCQYLVVAAGSSYKKHIPAFQGLDEYRGVLLHAAAFPDDDDKDGPDFVNKRVAVVGQGATGIQITQEVSKLAEKLTVFVRTPNTALPMHQRRLTVEEQKQWMIVYDHLFRLGRDSKAGFPFPNDGKTVQDTPRPEREARWEELWARGGFSFVGGFRDILTDPASNGLMYDFWREKVRARIRDPAKAAVLAPLVAPHPIATKRLSLEQDYYECMDRDNVDVVDLNATGIKSFDADGIVTADGRHRDFDVVVLATGYDAITGSFTAMGLRDVDGVDLRDRWRDGVRTYLGMTVPGFPNMFMIYSPQAPTALANGTTIIEIQADWIADAAVKMKTEGVETVEAEVDAAEKWAADIQAANRHTLFPLAESWYMGANIPGKKREQLNYILGVDTYEKVCRGVLEAWEGFRVGDRKVKGVMGS